MLEFNTGTFLAYPFFLVLKILMCVKNIPLSLIGKYARVSDCKIESELPLRLAEL